MPDARSGERGPEYFVTARGRLEVYDDRAVFFPDDNTPTIRASAAAAPQAVDGDGEQVEGASGAAAPPTAPAAGSLPAAAIQPVVTQAQSVSGHKLTPA